MSDENSYNSEESIKERALERKREDFVDLQNELAGRETGKTSRFLSKEERDRRSGKTASNQTRMSALDILLMDPEYRAAYNGLMNLLDDAEQDTQRSIDDAEVQLSKAKDDLEDTQNRASTLPDGTRVYQDKDGNVFSEDGTQIHSPETDSIVWKDGSPGYEEYLARRKSITDWQQYLDDLRVYQTDVLGSARDRMSDPDNPPSLDDIKKIENDIVSKKPASIRSEQEVVLEADGARGPETTPVMVPDL
ncbi:hypothetical protein [Kordiimonas sp.]|uniref:hypothetical protein n=1 Tax=Kordiimonas sp. TaxID=1970157 RepID=UPI003A940CF4